MSGAEVLAWLRWMGWSESSADIQPRESVPSSARNKRALISSVNRPCEAPENQIFEFVHLLGNQTPSLWPKQLLSLWERPDLVHKQVLGWRGGSWPARGLRSCFASACHLLPAPPWCASVQAQFLTIPLLPSPQGVGWSQNLGQRLKT